MKTTVIYHSADFDGIFCREIAKKFLPDADLIGWNFGDDKIPMPSEGTVYILDLSPDCIDFEAKSVADWGRVNANRIVWIDHHKSSIEKWTNEIPGYRIDGVAACRLAWQWFQHHRNWLPDADRLNDELPTKQDFVDRKVDEPLAVRLAGEYDVWDKRDPNAELFQHGLRSRELSSFAWSMMLSEEIPSIEDIEKMTAIGLKGVMYPDGKVIPTVVYQLLENGKVLQYAREQEYKQVITSQGFDLEFCGVKFLACCSHECDIRSQLFEAGIKPYHQALLGFTFTGKAWRVSMYRIAGKETDVLSIAKQFGGGHPGACGFMCDEFIFGKT